MLGFHFVAVAAVASMISALPTNVTSNGRTCGSKLSDIEMAAAEEYFNSHKPQSDMSAFATTIPVYWHIILSDNTLEGGNIPESQITRSIGVLNQDYSGSRVSFSLIATTRTTNSSWFNTAPGSQQQTDMKKTLRKGDSKTLNIYSVGSITNPTTGKPDVLGYATFPWSYSTNPQDDGVVLLYSTVPGGTSAPFNEGRTLTHEVGHWVGLYHTFEDHRGGQGSGCEGPGDYVMDTPAEYSAAFGCPNSRDTCPGNGVDPIHNFMDYTDDACMNEFTQGQITRFQEQLTTFRGVPLV
ncbi:hypothetical protein OPQ81_004545 [Rhizoctonia solani]|nr:hypothetical protein OPQ81_004545 [Rhizoctonia solani]